MTLVHSERLGQLAARATQLTASGELTDARQVWQESLDLLPPTSKQHEIIARRVSELDTRLAPPATNGQPEAKPRARRSWLSSGIAAALGLALLLVGKLKFLLLGLTKAKTFLSMFAFFGVYWSTFGWPLALGLVLSIYIHEMGHVAMLKRFNIAAGAPLFIPGIGALVRLKQRVDDPHADAAIGLAGPVWGLGAGLAAYVVYRTTGTTIWLAIAQLTGFINLFNLIPVWQLDGARGFHALTGPQRWLVVATLGAALVLTGQKLLIIVGAVAAWRALQRQAGPGNTRIVATFAVLIAALSWMSALKVL
ncbi:MAG: site-2 protease family protein [Gemmatimonadaceae bacterium]